MFTILEHLKNRYLSQRAQGIVEYALILAFVVLIAAALVSGGDLVNAVKAVFTDVVNKLKGTSNS